MLNEPVNRRGWRERLLDGLTLLCGLVALLVVGDRYLWPMIAGGEAGGSLEVVQVEKDLVGRSPGAVQLIAQGGGEELTMAFVQSTPQLVVLFRSDCPACQATKPVWERLAGGLSEGQQMHAITAEPLERGGGFFDSPRVKMWHAAQPDQYREAYPSPYVPTTLVIGSDGKIEYARIGVLKESDVKALKKLLERDRSYTAR